MRDIWLNVKGDMGHTGCSATERDILSVSDFYSKRCKDPEIRKGMVDDPGKQSCRIEIRTKR